MALTSRYTRSNLPPGLAETSAWPDCDVSQLTPAERTAYDIRRDGLLLYLSGERLSKIQTLYGLQSAQILRLLNRCVEQLDDGKIAGWIALVKGFRARSNSRSKAISSMPHLSRGGYTGALSLTLSRHPQIKVGLDKYLATGIDPSGQHLGRVTKQSAHEVFLAQCKEAGLKRNQWPFCVTRKGRASIEAYVHSFFSRNHQTVALLQYGEAASSKSRRGLKAGLQHIIKPTAFAPFDIIEADEHTAHAFFSLGIATPKGLKYVPCHRFTLIIVIDRFTNYILAWHIVARRQITSLDFLESMDKAHEGQCLAPEVLRALQSCSGATDGGNFEPRLGFSNVFVDNALAHLSEDVCTKVREATGASVSYGAPRSPERRALVEHVFSWISRVLFHRSLSTTGNSPADTRRNKPEKQAVRIRITLDKAIRATGVAVDRWNRKGTEANYGSSPIEQMISFYADGPANLVPLAPPRDFRTLPMRLAVASVPVRGSRKTGRAPCVSYASAEYTSPILAARWDLIGEKIRIHADPYDVSAVRAYTDDGVELGDLIPISSRWRLPHSLEMRRLLKARIRAVHDDPAVDPATLELEELESVALQANKKFPTSTRAATILAEESRKGYASRPLEERSQSSKSKTTDDLAKRVRTKRSINFDVLVKS